MRRLGGSDLAKGTLEAFRIQRHDSGGVGVGGKLSPVPLWQGEDGGDEAFGIPLASKNLAKVLIADPQVRSGAAVAPAHGVEVGARGCGATGEVGWF